MPKKQKFQEKVKKVDEFDGCIGLEYIFLVNEGYNYIVHLILYSSDLILTLFIT